MNVIRAKEAGWSIAVEHDREPEMDNVRYWIFTFDTLVCIYIQKKNFNCRASSTYIIELVNGPVILISNDET